LTDLAQIWSQFLLTKNCPFSNFGFGLLSGFGGNKENEKLKTKIRKYRKIYGIALLTNTIIFSRLILQTQTLAKPPAQICIFDKRQIPLSNILCSVLAAKITFENNNERVMLMCIIIIVGTTAAAVPPADETTQVQGTYSSLRFSILAKQYTYSVYLDCTGWAKNRTCLSVDNSATVGSRKTCDTPKVSECCKE